MAFSKLAQLSITAILVHTGISLVGWLCGKGSSRIANIRAQRTWFVEVK